MIYERGHIIFKQYEIADTLMFIEYGVAEVYTHFEGNEFIIDDLYSGSVLNYRSFLMEDLMHVNIRCKENCKILKLKYSELNKIM